MDTPRDLVNRPLTVRPSCCYPDHNLQYMVETVSVGRDLVSSIWVNRVRGVANRCLRRWIERSSNTVSNGSTNAENAITDSPSGSETFRPLDRVPNSEGAIPKCVRLFCLIIMSDSGTGEERDDGIELESTCDGGWAWVDTRSDDAGPQIVDTVENVEYAALSCVINGVDHLQIAELDAENEDAGAIPGRTIQSSTFHDLDAMR